MTLTRARWVFGLAALALYLWLGVLFYGTVLPGAGGIVPPDFRWTGYGLWDIVTFSASLEPEARDAYGLITYRLDTFFAAALALWIAAMAWPDSTGDRQPGEIRTGLGWRHIGVMALAAIYFAANFAEDRALYTLICLLIIDIETVAWSSRMTILKFAAVFGAMAAIAAQYGLIDKLRDRLDR